MNRSRLILLSLIFLAATLSARAATLLPGLEAPVTVVRDSSGVPHIFASSEHDVFFMQGFIHAQDRLFQMDLLRRQADGTLAELLGPSVLQTDVEIRTIGLNRAAARSLNAHSPDMMAVLQAYSDGVNAFIDAAEAAGQLPPEYGALELTSVDRWEPLSTVLVGKALGAATSLLATDDIDLTVTLQAYETVGPLAGIDGTSLFFDDLFRSAPFDPASTVPDALSAFHSTAATPRDEGGKLKGGPHLDEKAAEHARKYLERLRKLPRIPGVLTLDGGDMGGSNAWVVSGRHTPDSHPLLANDIHLRLESPTIFHEVHLSAPGIEVTGSSLAGAPCVIRGHNRHLAWGITNSRLDITDVYAEVIVVPDPDRPNLLFTLHESEQEAVETVIEAFSANVGGVVVPVFTRPVLIVPRRNNGPLITPPGPGPSPGTLLALSVQSVGFGPTRDPEGVCALNRATNLEEFKAGLKLIDFASQNFVYADTAGNIGYFISGELPLRQDLESSTPAITPPFLIRNGFSGNEWVPLSGPPPADQATPFGILPFEEMPQVVNPPGGIIVTANNDQAGNTLDNDPLNDFRAGGGRRYLNWGGRNFSIRAGRITEMIEERLAKGSRKISFGHMKRMQADIVLNDAKALVPFILEAFDNATRSDAHPVLASAAADPGVEEAVRRLRHWNFATPTGITEGFDADADETAVEASVAATIYSTWRGTMVDNTIDATLTGLGLAGVPRPAKREEVVTALKHLLDRSGVGESGQNFFHVPHVDDEQIRRDIVVLSSLKDALNLLASDAFAPAFGMSVNQDDYRWGDLHRIVFRHPLGSAIPALNVPPGAGIFPPPLEGLAGIPVDGGFETVDEAPPRDANNIRVSDSDSFMFDFGPTGRFVARLVPGKPKAETSLPGGESAIPGSPFYLNLLEPWLLNQTFPMLTSRSDVQDDAVASTVFVPAAP